jgi:hypothetical protein
MNFKAMTVFDQNLRVLQDALSAQKTYTRLIKTVGINMLWNTSAQVIQDSQDETTDN